ncbi:MAG: transposase [Proteobacteria bacterium]|nr:transposase [Pseudomonadota bacterium]MBU4471876.1 transposase [Pseudomonadota bacterium]MCG2751158.1 transposase [Desulfobacteraceae bacterium]
MPRQARIDAPGAVHHVIARGIERTAIFRDDQDREVFLKRLGEIITETHTRCFAWALMGNHFHLLLKTGNIPIASIMRRLLTGYAIYFNRRQHRSGHLFQNRYKSILCQEDVYLKELVRYIHLNPLRAKLVNDSNELDRYPYSGHSVLVGKKSKDWQSTDEVLGLFGKTKSEARRQYQNFLIKGIELGRQPDLVGGGLIRSAGGWMAVRAMQKEGLFQKSDERILGDGDFVEAVLSAARESMKTRYSLAARGITLGDILSGVSKWLSITPEDIVGASKERTLVKARNLICFWAVQDLGMTMTDVAGFLKISVSTASAAAKRGKKTTLDEHLNLTEILNAEMRRASP